MVGPIRSGKTVIIAKKGANIKNFTKLEDLKEHKIGCIAGYRYTDEFDKSTFLKKDQQSKDSNNLLNRLVNNRFPIIIGDLDSTLYTANQMGISDQIHVLPTVLKEFSRYVAFPKERPANAARFENALNVIRETGTLQNILDKWRK